MNLRVTDDKGKKVTHTFVAIEMERLFPIPKTSAKNLAAAMNMASSLFPGSASRMHKSIAPADVVTAARDRFKDEPLAVSLVEVVADFVGNGLDHNDFDITNIMMDRQGRVRLIDLGGLDGDHTWD